VTDAHTTLAEKGSEADDGLVAAPTLRRVLDGVTDLTVIALAIWTVLYHLALLLHIGSNLTLAAWVVLTVASAPWTLRGPLSERMAQGSDGPSTREPAAEPEADRSVSSRRRLPPWAPAATLVLVGLLSCLSAFLVGRPSPTLWRTGWILGLALVLVGWVWAIVLARRTPRTGGHVPIREGLPSSVARFEAWGAAVLAIVMAGLASISVRSDPDDSYYVNKSAWVADRGTFPTKDTIFSDQTLHAIPGAGVPVQSIESFLGALAHPFGLTAGTLVYLVVPAVGTFLAVWAMYRLHRVWAKRRALLALLVTQAYLLWGWQQGGTFGLFYVARTWQGKVLFLTLLIPLAYLYLTRWSRLRDRRSALLLLAAGATGVGLTSSATFLLAVISVAVAVTLLAGLGVRAAAGALLLMAYPVVTGVGVLVSATAGPGADLGTLRAGQVAFHYVVGIGGWASLGWVGLLAALWLVPRSARLVVAAAAVAGCMVFAPGVAELINAATGAGGVLWRLVWVAPIPVMFGLLVTVLPRRPRLPLGLVSAAVLVGLVAYAGSPIWDLPAARRNVHFTHVPEWKFPQRNLHEAWAIMDLDPGPGPVLAPANTMQALAITTTDVHAVDPRDSYTRAVGESPDRKKARIRLNKLIQTNPPQKSVDAAAADLKLLDVSLACAREHQLAALDTLREAGYTQSQQTAGLICLSRPG
jgi:hypothetical protein